VSGSRILIRDKAGQGCFYDDAVELVKNEKLLRHGTGRRDESEHSPENPAGQLASAFATSIHAVERPLWVSKTEVDLADADFRFTPQSRHPAAWLACPKSAKSGSRSPYLRNWNSVSLGVNSEPP
jgi:hypothetical protein